MDRDALRDLCLREGSYEGTVRVHVLDAGRHLLDGAPGHRVGVLPEQFAAGPTEGDRKRHQAGGQPPQPTAREEASAVRRRDEDHALHEGQGL